MPPAIEEPVSETTHISERKVDKIVIKHPTFSNGGAKTYEYRGAKHQMAMIQHLGKELGLVEGTYHADFVYVWNSRSTLQVILGPLFQPKDVSKYTRK